MEFRILGSFEVAGDEGPVDLPRGRGLALLALLVLRAGETVSVDQLIDDLWGAAAPPTARSKLHVLVSDLRKRLVGGPGSPSPIRTRPPGYVLDLEGSAVDAHRFRRLVAEAAHAPAVEKAHVLREALGLWRGHALADFLYQPFCQQDIAALEELRFVAICDRIDADLELGRHADLVAELEALVGEHPFRERTRRQLMLALYRCGRQAESLEVYRRTRATLVEELGIEPGPDLQDLEQAILRQNPSLRLPSALSTDTGRESVESTVQHSWISEGRKPVTVVFSEITWADEDARDPDPETFQRMVARGYERVSQVLGRHGGTVEGLIGGVVVAVFGVPVVHEDDALRAIRAADEINGAVRTLNEELDQGRVSARSGVNSGEVIVGGTGLGRTGTSGDTVDMAARLQRAATDGEILVGDATRRLVGHAATFGAESSVSDSRGRTRPAWRLVELVGHAPVGRESPMVGRTDEIARLRAAHERTVAQQRATLAVVVGEAGVGKSRLVSEFVDSVRGRALVLTGRCPAYGEGITFWPLREVVLQAAGEPRLDAVAALFTDGGEDDTAIAHVAGAIGLAEDPRSPTELFGAIRRLFEGLARRRAVIAVFEDVHWAESTFLDLVDYLAASISGPVLLVAVARPEILQRQERWAPDRTRGVSILLPPLDFEASRELLARRTPSGLLSEETVDRLVELAHGNPLFLEQLQAARYDGGEQSIPPSLRALLVARLDGLGPAERDVLRCASIVGEEFSTMALAALIPDEARPFVSRHLEALSRRELIKPPREPHRGEPQFAFRHVLIQLAAYGSLTRRERAKLHAEHARWLGEEMGDRSLEFEELIGYHLEQACEHRRIIGLEDDLTAALAAEAGEKLATAGLRAFARMDIPGAANLLGRAKSMLPPAHPLRPDVTRHLPEVHEMLGQHVEADAILAEALDATDAGQLDLRRRISLERARIQLFRGPDPTPLERINEEAEEAMAAFISSGDHAGVAQATIILGLVHLRRGRPAKMEEVSRLGLKHADLSGYQREVLASRWWVALALAGGTTPVDRCIRECEELVRLGDEAHAGILAELGRLHAMSGEFDEARRLLDEAQSLIIERMRAPRPLMFVTSYRGEVEVLAGAVDRAEAELRDALEMARGMDEAEVIAQVAASLSLLLPTDSEEAGGMAALSAARAPAEEIRSQSMWRSAEARVLAGRDEPQAAERLARQAVELVGPEMPNLRGDRQLDLAGVLLATGQRAAARPVIEEAIDLYNRKGNLTSAARGAAMLEQA